MEKSVSSLPDTNSSVNKGTFRKGTAPGDSPEDTGCDLTHHDNKNKQRGKVTNTPQGKDYMGSTELKKLSKTQNEGDGDDSRQKASESDSTEEDKGGMDSGDSEDSDGMEDGENIESDAINEMDVQDKDEQNKNEYDEEMGN